MRGWILGDISHYKANRVNPLDELRATIKTQYDFDSQAGFAQSNCNYRELSESH